MAGHAKPWDGAGCAWDAASSIGNPLPACSTGNALAGRSIGKLLPVCSTGRPPSLATGHAGHGEGSTATRLGAAGQLVDSRCHEFGLRVGWSLCVGWVGGHGRVALFIKSRGGTNDRRAMFCLGRRLVPRGLRGSSHGVSSLALVEETATIRHRKHRPGRPPRSPMGISA